MEERIHRVYKITCPGNEIYIGQSKNSLEERWDRGRGYRGCTTIYAVIQKYGPNNPGIKKEFITGELTKQEADEMEQYYIAYYRSIPGCIVLNEQSGGTSNWTASEDTKKRISEGGKEYYKNHPERAKKHSEDMKRYYEEHPEERDRMGELSTKIHEKHPELRKAASKKIVQYTYNMEYVASYNSLREASKATGINEITISGCLRDPNQYTAGGYRWYYDDGKIHPIIQYRLHDSKPVGVIQKDKKTGEIIAKYNSISEAADKTRIPHSNISRCIQPNNTKYKSAGGFIWERDED